MRGYRFLIDRLHIYTLILQELSFHIHFTYMYIIIKRIQYYAYSCSCSILKVGFIELSM